MSDESGFDLGNVASAIEAVAPAILGGAVMSGGFGGYGYGPSWGYYGHGYGYGGRRSSGILAALLGIVLLLASLWLIYWNEGQLVYQRKLIDAQLKTVIELDPNNATAEPPDRIVHVAGWTESEGTPRDPLLAVSAPNALFLQRKVEMYQWQEKVTHRRHRLGNYSTGDTTATYTRVWAEAPIVSAHFQYQEGHENPATFPEIPGAQPVAPPGARPTLPAALQKLHPQPQPAPVPATLASARFDATNIRLSAYQLGPEILSQMTKLTPVTLTEAPNLPDFALSSDSMYYKGSDSTNPQIGDVRITYQSVAPQNYGVMGTLHGMTLTGFHNGFNLALAEPGLPSARKMLQTDRYRPEIQTWLYRGMAFAGIFLAFMMMAAPIEALVAWIPLLGGLVEMGIFLAAFTLAVPLTAIAIALAWVGQRPILAGGLIVIGGGFGAVLWWRHLGVARHEAQVKDYMARKQAAEAPHAEEEPTRLGGEMFNFDSAR